jgi:wyosine [tRNA(Phe)-imidazoG37] synthetase (radical SAM superfamily)
MSILFNEIVFGPVRSRRLGTSLGINLSPVDGKLCNFNCIYCECGWNEDNKPESFGFHTKSEIKEALDKKLAKMAESDEYPDSITFSGNGEPTMHPDFAGIMNDVISLRDRYTPAALVSVLSNATLIHKTKVFNALKKADRAILKLDSGIDETIAIINCPQGTYSVKRIIENLKSFDGNMILQTMFLRGEYNNQLIDNTTDREIAAWLNAVTEINPKEIMIYGIDRATPAKNLQKISRNELEQIAIKATLLGYNVKVSG